MPDADTIIGLALLIIAAAIVARVVLGNESPERPEDRHPTMPDNVTIPAERPAAPPPLSESQPGADPVETSNDAFYSYWGCVSISHPQNKVGIYASQNISATSPWKAWSDW
jgi:hypothetical protein